MWSWQHVKITSAGATAPRPLLNSKSKILRTSCLILRLLAASWRLPALPKTVLPSTRQPRFAETPAAVYAVWALAPKASQNTAWNGGSGQLDQMSRALGPVSDPRFRPRHRRSRLRGLGGLPQTPSAVYAKTRFGAPVYAPRGVAKNDAMSRVLGLVFESLGPPQAAPKIAQHEPLKAVRKQNH